MGFDKLFAGLRGKPVLSHSIEAFVDHPEVDLTVVVTSEANREAIAALNSETKLLLGGTERHFSVANGLAALPDDCDLVAVHDGARPLIHPDSITACLSAARKNGAASCARRVTETMKRADESARVTESVSRENLWAMETPQCFQLDLLRRAYDKVLGDDQLVTDEVSAVEALGEPVYLVENPHPNLKITFPADLELAERLLER